MPKQARRAGAAEHGLTQQGVVGDEGHKRGRRGPRGVVRWDQKVQEELLGGGGEGSESLGGDDEEIMMLRRELGLLRTRDRRRMEAMARAREKGIRDKQVASLKSEIEALRLKSVS